VNTFWKKYGKTYRDMKADIRPARKVESAVLIEMLAAYAILPESHFVGLLEEGFSDPVNTARQDICLWFSVMALRESQCINLSCLPSLALLPKAWKYCIETVILQITDWRIYIMERELKTSLTFIDKAANGESSRLMTFKLYDSVSTVESKELNSRQCTT
jgi:hypothetical protein